MLQAYFKHAKAMLVDSKVSKVKERKEKEKAKKRKCSNAPAIAQACFKHFRIGQGDGMTELETELAKIPAGTRYILAENFRAIWKILREQNPLLRNGKVVTGDDNGHERMQDFMAKRFQ